MPLWRNRWYTNDLPKVNTLCWMLVQGKILTAENLAKKGIQGPSQCVLCKNDGETSGNVFQICPFSHSVWLHDLGKIGYTKVIPSTWEDMFTRWKCRYTRPLQTRSVLSWFWTGLTKYLCWQIWLIRNKAIFKNMYLSPAEVAKTTIALLSDALNAKEHI